MTIARNFKNPSVFVCDNNASDHSQTRNGAGDSGIDCVFSLKMGLPEMDGLTLYRVIPSILRDFPDQTVTEVRVPDSTCERSW